MKIYLIVSSREDTPSKDLLTKLKKFGKLTVIRHKGKLSEINQLRNDKEEKVLGVDPKVFNWELDVETLKDISNVKAICTSSTSFDWLKPKELKKMGTVACNVSDWSTDSVAEYALSMAINVARGLPMVIKNNWKYNVDDYLGVMLNGRTAGIVGLGKIGTRMAEICQGIGMKVIYWSRKTRDKRFEYVGINKLFKEADVIMPALVENVQTKKIISRKALDRMKPTAILIGIGRVRELWDEEYVLKKVERKEMWGYAMEDNELKHISKYKGNVLPVPSMAVYTKDAFENLIKIWVDNIINASKGKYTDRVN